MVKLGAAMLSRVELFAEQVPLTNHCLKFRHHFVLGIRETVRPVLKRVISIATRPERGEQLSASRTGRTVCQLELAIHFARRFGGHDVRIARSRSLGLLPFGPL